MDLSPKEIHWLDLAYGLLYLESAFRFLSPILD